MVMNAGRPPGGGSLLGLLPNLFSGGGGMLSSLSELMGGGGGMLSALSGIMGSGAGSGFAAAGNQSTPNYDINDLLNRLSSMMNNNRTHMPPPSAGGGPDIEVEPIIETTMADDGGFRAEQTGGGYKQSGYSENNGEAKAFNFDDAAPLLALLNELLLNKEKTQTAPPPQPPPRASAAANTETPLYEQELFRRGFEDGYRQGRANNLASDTGEGSMYWQSPYQQAADLEAEPYLPCALGCDCLLCRLSLPAWAEVRQMAASWQRY